VKCGRLAAFGADVTSIRFVPVDFDRQTVGDRLVEAGFRPSTYESTPIKRNPLV
jgi:O-methyltransferase involved in polyketide biosynthesis